MFYRAIVCGIFLGLVIGGLITSRPLAEVGQHGDLMQSGKTPQVVSPARTMLMDEAPVTLQEAERPAVGRVPTEPSPSGVVRVDPLPRFYTREQSTAIILTAAEEFGADPELMLRIADCESQRQAGALNGRSGAGGLYQFLLSSWSANARAIGLDGSDQRFDPVASARVAAAKIVREGGWAWKASEGCWKTR